MEIRNDVVQFILGWAEYQAFSVGKQKPFGALSKMGEGDVVFIEKSHSRAAFYKADSKYTISKSGGPDMSAAFILPGRKEKQPEKGWRWLWQSSFGRGIQRFFSAQSHNDEQARDGNRVYIRQHPAKAGHYSYSELWKEGRLLTSEELDQIEGRVRRVAKTVLWHDCVPLDDLSDMGTLCVWDVPRLMGMISVLSQSSKNEGFRQAQEGQI